MALAACGSGSDTSADTTDHDVHAQQVVQQASTAAPTVAPTTVGSATSAPVASTVPPAAPTTSFQAHTGRALIPGMPPLTDARNVYAATTGPLNGPAKEARELVYVPHNGSGDVWVIDPKTYKVIDRFATGAVSQHVVPSWDMTVLYANNNVGNTLTPIDPTTGKPGVNIPIEAPYNLYFTPDGKYALVMEERNAIIAWRDVTTPKLDVVKRVRTPCVGPNHVDFSADGTYFLVSCEFSGEVLKVDTQNKEVVGKIKLPARGSSKPQDTRLTPDGKSFLIADMDNAGIWELDGEKLEVIRFIPTAGGAHGIYPSRDTKWLYITNRHVGSISVMDAATREIKTTWQIPGGGSPDMGNITADGKEFWVSGRNHNVVYVINVEDPDDLSLTAKISVGRGPHGLAVWPQPGRYSLGHTGNMR